MKPFATENHGKDGTDVYEEVVKAATAIIEKDDYLSVHKEIDKAKWDVCIQAKPKNAIVYAYSWYLDIVSPGWSALVEDNYTTVFLLLKERNSDLHICSNRLSTQQLGLFTSQKNKTRIPGEFSQCDSNWIQVNWNSIEHRQFTWFKK